MKTGPYYPRPQRLVDTAFHASQFSDLWVCGLAIAFGVVLATGTARWLGIFSSRAEALLLMRADAAPVTVAAYLELRAVFTALAQGITRFAYLIVFGLPSGSTSAALVAQLIFFAAAGAAIASVALPRALARGAIRTALIVGGMGDRGRGRAAADRGRVAHRAARRVGHAAAPHPRAASRRAAARARDGRRARRCDRRSRSSACATAAFAVAARDAYPELYTLSLANLDWRERARIAARRARGCRCGRAARQERAQHHAHAACAVRWRSSGSMR